MEEKEKRSSGMIVGGAGRLDIWLVLKESKKTVSGEEDVHNCGTPIEYKDVDIKTSSGQIKKCRVPYCPTCEKAPADGTYDDMKNLVHINS